jgi:DNA-binding CsgD family transcriptional regulator
LLEDLSHRERAVLGQLCTGSRAADAADRLGESVGTVRSDVRSILRTLGVATQMEAVTLVHRAATAQPAHSRLGPMWSLGLAPLRWLWGSLEKGLTPLLP